MTIPGMGYLRGVKIICRSTQNRDKFLIPKFVKQQKIEKKNSLNFLDFVESQFEAQ